MNSPSGDTGVDAIQLILKEIIRRAVAQEFPRQTVTPGFDLSKLLSRAAVDPFPLGNESADQAIVTLYGSLLARGIGMGEADQRFAQVFQPGQQRELGVVVCRNRLEDIIPVSELASIVCFRRTFLDTSTQNPLVCTIPFLSLR